MSMPIFIRIDSRVIEVNKITNMRLDKSGRVKVCYGDHEISLGPVAAYQLFDAIDEMSIARPPMVIARKARGCVTA